MNWGLLFAQWAGILLYMAVDSASRGAWWACACYAIAYVILLGLAYGQSNRQRRLARAEGLAAAVLMVKEAIDAADLEKSPEEGWDKHL